MERQPVADARNAMLSNAPALNTAEAARKNIELGVMRKIVASTLLVKYLVITEHGE